MAGFPPPLLLTGLRLGLTSIGIFRLSDLRLNSSFYIYPHPYFFFCSSSRFFFRDLSLVACPTHFLVCLTSFPSFLRLFVGFSGGFSHPSIFDSVQLKRFGSCDRCNSCDLRHNPVDIPAYTPSNELSLTRPVIGPLLAPCRSAVISLLFVCTQSKNIGPPKSPAINTFPLYSSHILIGPNSTSNSGRPLCF